MKSCSRGIVVSVGVGLALLTTGCATVGFTPPDITLVDVAFSDLTLFESSGRLTVRIANENSDPIVVDGGVYNLYLNGIRVGKGLTDANFEVARLSSATTDIEVFINNIALATRLRQIIDSGSVDYRLKGKLFLDRLGRRAQRFDRSGRYEFKRRNDGDPLDLEGTPFDSTDSGGPR